MADLGRLPKCYKGKGHRMAFIIPPTKRGDVSMACERCGIVRQFPATRPPVPLDDMSVDEIEARIFGRVPHG